MTIHFKVQKDIDINDWQKIADKCDYATFFHTPLWSKIFTETFPHMKIAVMKFTFEDDTLVVFPMIRMAQLRMAQLRMAQLRMAQPGPLQPSTHVSNAGYVYGGWICNHQLTFEQGMKIVVWIKKNIKNLYWLTNPFDKSLVNFDFFGVGEIKDEFTQYIDLSLGYETIWKQFSRTHRQEINKAQRKGVTFRMAKSIDDWRKYYAVYLDSIDRWGYKAKFVYPFGLFENMFACQSDNIKLYLAIVNGKVVSGALALFHNKHVVGWHGSTFKEFFSYHPWYLLMNQITKDACKGGYRWFDFNPSGGHEGVIKNKKGFGTTKIPLKIITKSSDRILNKILRTLFK